MKLADTLASYSLRHCVATLVEKTRSEDASSLISFSYLLKVMSVKPQQNKSIYSVIATIKFINPDDGGTDSLPNVQL